MLCAGQQALWQHERQGGPPPAGDTAAVDRPADSAGARAEEDCQAPGAAGSAARGELCTGQRM